MSEVMPNSDREPTSGTLTDERLPRLQEALEAALDDLQAAPPFTKPLYQTPFFRAAADLMDSGGGMALLARHAERFDSAGVFHGGPWSDPAKLVPDLVAYGLKGDGVYPTVEALSELRMLAIAEERVPEAKIEPERARRFLREVCTRNLDLMFPAQTEETRARPKVHRRAERLFEVIRRSIPIDGLRQTVVDEIEVLAAQRPIQTQRIERLIHQAAQLPAGEDDASTRERLALFESALGAVTDLSVQAGDPVAYRRLIRQIAVERVAEEGEAFADRMNRTGLTSPYHAVVLRRLGQEAPELVAGALGVNEVGAAQVRQDPALVAQLVRVAVFPHTHRAIDGFAGSLDRGLLSRPPVVGGLRRLIDLAIRPDVSEMLLAPYPAAAGLSPNTVLLAGTLGVLGRPLGVGQGNNPTCQSARGISLWSQHAPGLLLQMAVSAARDGLVETDFEGQRLRSCDLGEGLLKQPADPELDALSKVLVPHLDRIYARMMELVVLRGEDGHKWVNPAMYGQWVSKGFESAIDPGGQVVRRHQAFVRRFFATHHPDYNDGHALIYPNPVGLMITSAHGDLLGPHAVSIQRIAAGPDGQLRVFFFNPNNEGRQDWGNGVSPTVFGHGERPGESSLPFGHFASRLYAFHFDPYEQGDAYAVATEEVDEVTRLARHSWGRAYTWLG